MEHRIITAVGIDVSKYKSMVAVRRPGGEVVMEPFEVQHTAAGIAGLVSKLAALDGEVRVVMEHTGMYWRPVAMALKRAGFFVSVVNAMLIHRFSDNSLRKVKTDKADAMKIANYALAYWQDLRDYSETDETRQGALVAFAGVDAPPFQSGTFDPKNWHVSKRGSPHLRAALFRVCSVVLQCKDEGNAVYAFMDRKRAEGKHYYVYMVAGAAKFLRIYYARVKECLAAA